MVHSLGIQRSKRRSKRTPGPTVGPLEVSGTYGPAVRPVSRPTGRQAVQPTADSCVVRLLNHKCSEAKFLAGHSVTLLDLLSRSSCRRQTNSPPAEGV